MAAFISPERRQLLELNRLNSFDQIWKHQADWFEDPNNGRGGWSGVGRVVLKLPQGGEMGVFLKRQDNHRRRTLRHPFSGEPTFSCEFRTMHYLQKHDVPIPKLLFFAERLTNGHHQAILMTEELVNYRSLEQITEDMFAYGHPTLAVQRSIIRGVAATVRKLHEARIQHRSLYPKHLFVKMQGQSEPGVVVIDLEKSRVKILPTIRALHDLAMLNRHTHHWSRTSRLYFLKQYYGIDHLGPWTKLLCRFIQKRSARRK